MRTPRLTGQQPTESASQRSPLAQPALRRCPCQTNERKEAMTHPDQLIDEAGEMPGTLEYIGTTEELADADGGFSILHIDEMPEHESEYVAEPGC